MIIIAESGSTKTDWRSIHEDGSIICARTSGMNPAVMDHRLMSGCAASAIPVLNPEGRHVDKIFFYGAGLVSSGVETMMRSVLDMWCPFAEIEFHSDLEAASRALFGNGTGVAAIIGTGSNSCLWEEGRIVRNIRPGGYVLGDEGGAVSLGRMLLSDIIKDLVPSELSARFDEAFGLDYPSIVEGVYRSGAPSKYLGSFARFVYDNRDLEYADELIRENFRNFMRRSLARYGCSEAGVVGSFGTACRDILCETGHEFGLEFVKFIQSPIDELAVYHLKNR